MSKARLRSALSERRRAIPVAQARAAGEAVARWILADARIAGAQRIALYAAAHGEVPTQPLFDALRSPGRTLLLPRIRRQRLEWAEVRDWEHLEAGRYGILEPRGATARPPLPGEVLLMPSLAFDLEGWRLGRGAGFYDRAFPPEQAAPWLVAVGYAFQCLDAVPHESHDRRVDAIVSEEGLRWRQP